MDVQSGYWGVPCERPGPAGSGGEPLPYTWRAGLSRAGAAALRSPLVLGFAFLPRSRRLPRGRGAAATPQRRPVAPAGTAAAAGFRQTLLPLRTALLPGTAQHSGLAAKMPPHGGERVSWERELLMEQRVTDKVCITLSFAAV